MSKLRKCNLCGNEQANQVISVVESRPELETDYGISEEKYFREICLCSHCSAYFNSYASDLLPENFYSGYYNKAIDSGQLIERFNRIISLSFSQSDNKQRVKRIVDQLTEKTNWETNRIHLLDVGSGTGVFLHEMEKYIKNVFCVDPDPLSIQLINKLIKVKKAWVGSIGDIPKDYSFQVITFNKVLEHVEDPISLLQSACYLLDPNGVIYIELPYSDHILSENMQKERAEFFIEHLVVYNHDSLAFLIETVGLQSIHSDVVIEPSGKHTIYAFCKLT